MTRIAFPLAAPACALLLAACASDGGGEPAAPPPRGAPAGAPEARAPGCGPLFVSPAGEPFRRAPDAPGCPMRTWFTGADADGDGALTRTEFRQDALRFFAVLDRDGNGYIDGAELQDYEHRIAPEILDRGGDGPRGALSSPRPRLWAASMQIGGGGGGGFGGGGGGGGGGRGGRGGGRSQDEGATSAPKGELETGVGLARFGLLGEPEPVAAADLDLNGRITREEFATRADQRFHSLDEADTGRLVYADLEQRMRERGREGGRRGGGGRGGGSQGGGGRGGHGGGGGGRGGGLGGPPQA